MITLPVEIRTGKGVRETVVSLWRRAVNVVMNVENRGP